MKRTAFVLIAVLLLIGCFSGCTNTSSTNNTVSSAIPATKEEITLRRGINLSALEGKNKYEKYYLNQESTYVNIASKGFDHIRLPVDFRNYADEEGTLDDKKMQEVDRIIERANENGLVVFLDFHGWYDVNTAKGDDMLFLRIWKNVAERYKDYDKNHMLIFELINEPHTTEGGNLDMKNLDKLQCAAVDLIRDVTPDRTVCVATADWNGTWTLKPDHYPSFRDTKISKYDNIIVAVHTYAPLDWTHQGMAWAGTEDKIFKLNAAHLAELRESLSELVLYAKETKVPVILNEFGFNTDTSVIPIEDQVKYAQTVIEILNKYDIPCTWWEYNHGFGLYRKEGMFSKAEWSEEVLEVIFK